MGNRIKKQLDKEFKDFEFLYDSKSIRKANSTRKIRLTVCFTLVFMLVFAGLFASLNVFPKNINIKKDVKEKILLQQNESGLKHEAIVSVLDEKEEISINQETVLPFLKLEEKKTIKNNTTYYKCVPFGVLDFKVTGSNISVFKVKSDVSRIRDYYYNIKKEVVVNYRDDNDYNRQSHNSVEWEIPSYINKWVLFDGATEKLDYTKIPKDIVTITIYFNDGTTRKSVYELYFSKDGNLVINPIQ